MRKWFFFVLFVGVFSTAFAADPAPANQVFIPKARVFDPNTLLLEWSIKPGTYLYKDRIKLVPKDEQTARLGRLTLPQGLAKTDSVLGDYEIYRQRLKLAVPILGLQPGEARFQVRYQGCTDDGFCYPPTQCELHLTFDNEHGLINARFSTPETVVAPPQDESESAFDILQNQSFWFVILSFFGFGLLLSLTPCVLPMIPVLSGIIIGHGKQMSTRHALLLSVVYVLSMSLTYAVIGIVVAKLGANLQTALQLPWVIALMSGVFVLLSLSMFGFYDLKMPTWFQARLANISHHQKSGAILGVAIMGCLATLILSPCVTAPLVGALSYIASTGDMLLGGVALFTLGLGMGVPLLMVGATCGKYLPKAGHWMDNVKFFFGILLLAVAIYLIDRIIPDNITLFLWACLFIISAVFMGAFRKVADTANAKLFKGLGLLIFIYGATLLVGASMGNSDPFKPLATTSHQQASMQNSLTVKTYADLRTALKNARDTKREVMLDYYADWCVACKILEKTVLNQPNVQTALNQYTVIKVDITANDNEAKQLSQAYNIIAPPTFVFIDANGEEVPRSRIIGEKSASEFVKRIP